MKGLRTLAATLLAGAALLAVAPAPAGAAAYQHYVACGISQHAKQSHVCPQKPIQKGAFFKSTGGTVTYSVCVKFPTHKSLCKRGQEAVQGTLYVNPITSNISGVHVVSWFVHGQKVGSFAFRVAG